MNIKIIQNINLEREDYIKVLLFFFLPLFIKQDDKIKSIKKINVSILFTWADRVERKFNFKKKGEGRGDSRKIQLVSP